MTHSAIAFGTSTPPLAFSGKDRQDQRRILSLAVLHKEYAGIEYAGLPVNYCVFSILLCSNYLHQTSNCR